MLSDVDDHSPRIDPSPASDDRSVRARLRDVIRHDVPASLVVFLVALPLSLGIAVASNAPIMAGLIAAVVGGVVAGAIGGSPLLASGPAAGLTVVVAGLISQFGWGVTCAITVAAGAIQILLGLSRVARSALAISPVVVHAMLAGIGLTIALQQLHVLLGGNSRSSVWLNLTQLPSQLMNIHLSDVFVGGTVIAIMVLWKRLPSRLTQIPAALVAVVTATVLSVVLPVSSERITLNGSIFDAIALPSLPEGRWAAFAAGVLTVALIASVESLLSAVAVDKMHAGPKSDLDRELIGQGAANMVSGTLGGLAITGVIVRSATNVAAGAKTRASTILHGIWVLLFSVLLLGVVQQIPKAALAGLLIVIGVQLVKLAHIRLAHRTGDLWVYASTVAGVLFLNLLEGVLIGLAVAVGLVLWRAASAVIYAEPVNSHTGTDWHLVIEGTCSFLALPKLSGVLATVPPGSTVKIELTADYIDHAAADVIQEWARRHRQTGGDILIDDIGAAALAASAQQPPRRHVRATLAHGLAPWKTRQPNTDNATATPSDIPAGLRPVLDGISHYHRRQAPLLREHLQDLHTEQRPTSLFIACSDSRVMPNIITSSGPGDLFTVRNVGNLIPKDHADSSIEAALAFAVDKLDIASIIVCGHSGCAAMATLLDNNSGVSDSIYGWLGHATPTLLEYQADHPVARAAQAAGFDTAADQLAMVNVAIQMRTLHQHPLLATAIRAGNLHIIGLFFDIASAQVWHITTDGISDHATATNDIH